MAKVLIQQGVERLERQHLQGEGSQPVATDSFREVLELQERQGPRRLRGAPRRLRFTR
jgi:hypothetical protein